MRASSREQIVLKQCYAVHPIFIRSAQKSVHKIAFSREKKKRFTVTARSFSLEFRSNRKLYNVARRVAYNQLKKYFSSILNSSSQVYFLKALILIFNYF
jgi:hypothetical protein